MPILPKGTQHWYTTYLGYFTSQQCKKAKKNLQHIQLGESYRLYADANIKFALL